MICLYLSTQIYAYADVEMKRIALEKCQRKVENEYDKLPEWKTDDEMLKKMIRTCAN